MEFRVSVIIVILVVLDLRCCAQAFCSCDEWGLLIAPFPATRGQKPPSSR